MLVGRLIAYVLLIIALGAYVAWRLLLARKKRGRSSILVALLVLVLGLGLALATLGWAISPGIPGVIDYSGHRFAIGQGGQGGVSGPGEPIRCQTVSQL